ncbi:MAG: N-acetylmuramoyl-L-alanine amidase [Saprospiraceae bacterium]
MMKTLVLNSILFLSTSLVFAGNFNSPLTSVIDFKESNAGFNEENVEIVYSLRKKNNADYKIKTVVIDAGHGGKDGGCSGKNSKEKVIALGVAKRLKNEINNNYPTIKVIMTRDDDVFIPLHERAAIANRNNADLFISIHCNYIVGASHINGSETYVLGLHRVEANLAVAKRENEVIYLEEGYEKNYPVDPNSTAGHIILSAYQLAHLEQSILLAENIEKHIGEKHGHSSRGVRQAGFHVLRETTMPSVLVETGYLSNSNDEAFLLTAEGQDKIANAIYLAFKDYKDKVETFTPTDTPIFAEVGKPSGSLASTGETPGSTITIEKEIPKKENSKPAEPQKQVKPEPKVIPVASKVEEKKPEKANKPEVVEFRIQLAASKTSLGENNPRWSDVGYRVKEIQEGEYFKYQVTGFSTYDAAYYTSGVLKNKNFKDCFIVAYKGSSKLGLAEARSLSN